MQKLQGQNDYRGTEKEDTSVIYCTFFSFCLFRFLLFVFVRVLFCDVILFHFNLRCFWRAKFRDCCLSLVSPYLSYFGHVSRKCIFEHAQYAPIQINPDMHKVASGHLYSIDTFYMLNDSISGQRMLWSDWADAQDDLGFRSPHMLEGTFSHARPI